MFKSSYKISKKTMVNLSCYTNQFKKPLNKKDGFCKSLISGCFAEGKTPALLLLSPRRPQGGAGYRY